MSTPERRPQSHPFALPAPPDALSHTQRRDFGWTEAALGGELDTLTQLPEGENVNKPDSAFFACLLRTAAIIKGSGRSYISPPEALAVVKAACGQYPWFQEREIERQWKNAYNLANARCRREELEGE